MSEFIKDKLKDIEEEFKNYLSHFDKTPDDMGKEFVIFMHYKYKTLFEGLKNDRS